MMRNYLRAVMLIGAGCLSFPTSAQGDTQTVENAQYFLSLVLTDAGYVPGSMRTGIAYASRNLRYGQTASIGGRTLVTDASALSRCVSQILFDISQLRFVFSDRGEKYEQNALTFLKKAWGDDAKMPGTNVEGFHWGDVVSAVQEGAVVSLKFKGAEHSSQILLGDDAMAKRVVYAINFLRMECDPAGSTGF